MSNAKRLVAAAAVAILLLVSTVCAQGQSPASGAPSGITVTAAATADRVRFTAPGTVAQMRLEVYNANGQKLFDVEIRGGNVIDWHLQDGQAQRLSDGSYLCVITTKSLSGRMGQKSGRLTIENAVASVEPLDTTQLTAQQTQAVGPLEENASLTIMKEGESQTATVIAHDGTDGQIIRGKGALSFRIGDFFTGKDAEQMRLTPEGNLGIGITNPAARLDVDGLIRASHGIVFPDGSIQFSASRKTFGPESLRPGQSLKKNGQGKDFETASPDTSGTGTTGKIPKWLDGPGGVLADSNITELNGAIGINGTPNTNFRLDVNGSVLFRGSNPGFNLVGLRPAGNTWAFQTVDDDGRFRLFSQDNSNPGVERLTIGLSTGNVGIGTPTPEHRMSIAGGPGWTADNWGGAVALQNASAIGWQTNASGNRYGIGHTTAGLAFFRTAGNLGTTASPATYDLRIDNFGNVGIGSIGLATGLTSKMEIFAQDGLRISGFQPFLTLHDTNAGNKSSFMQGVNGDAVLLTNSRAALIVKDVTGSVGIGTTAPNAQLQIAGTGTNGFTLGVEGNVTQNRDKSGFVKAMLVVNADGTIARCYNGMTNSSSGNCGFTIDHSLVGFYGIGFGFQVDDRFASVTPHQEPDNIAAKNVSAMIAGYSGNVVAILIFYTDDRNPTGWTNDPFTIIVF